MPALTDALSAVATWKEHVPIESVLSGEADGRSVSGMTKAVERMKAADTDRMAASMLGNYNRIIKTAQKFAEVDIQSMNEDELEETLQVLEQESVAIPERIQRDLLKRRTTELLQHR